MTICFSGHRQALRGLEAGKYMISFGHVLNYGTNQVTFAQWNIQENEVQPVPENAYGEAQMFDESIMSRDIRKNE